MKKQYSKPLIISEKSFETTALACGKTPSPPFGSHHFTSVYDTFTGHFGPGMGANESASGQLSLAFGITSTSQFYPYWGLCGNWVTLSS